MERRRKGTSGGAKVNRVAPSNPAGQEAHRSPHILIFVQQLHVYWKQDCMWIQAVLDGQEVIQHQLRFLAGGGTVRQISVADLISSVLFFQGLQNAFRSE